MGCTTSETVEVDAGDTAPLDLGATLIDVGIDRAVDAGAADGFRLREAVVIPNIDSTTTSLPLCDDPATRVNGLPGRPCAGLDSLCSRGVRTASGCCGQAPRWHGTGCGDGMACDTGGNCVATTDAPWEANSIVGDQTWLDILTDGEKSLITLEPTGFQARFDDASLVDVRPDDGSKIDVGDVHIAHGRAQGLEAVAIAAPDTASRRAVYLLTAPHTADICVVRGDFDTMGPVSADCDSPGATRISCPDGDADTHCLVLEDGGVQISGDDLAMVFEMGTFGEQPEGTDVRRALTVDSLDHRWYTATSGTSPRARPAAFVFAPTFGCSPAQCTFGQVQFSRGDPAHGIPATCLASPFATRSCGLFGCWNPWTLPPEICDGKDNNCNGTIDEGGGAVLCNDNLGCTTDACNRLNASSPPSCRHYANPDALCTPPGDPNRQDCILPRCTVAGVAYGRLISAPTGGSNRLSPVDSRGCSFLERDDYCTNTWDSCDCNAKETCGAGWNLADTSGCRNSPRMQGSQSGTGVNAWSGNYPCERDKLYCTFGGCCEPDARCRDLELLPDDQRQQLASVCNSVLTPTTTVVSPTGGVVECIDVAEQQATFDDGKPCTDNFCNEPNPNGTQGWLPIPFFNPIGGRPPGCNTSTNEGCGNWTCVGGNGTCRVERSGVAVTACSQSSGTMGCARAACSNGFCERTPNAALCPRDSLSCTGAPQCSSSFVCSEPVTAGSCAVNNMCVAVGTFRPGSPCWMCSGGTGWSPSPSSTMCNDDDGCTNNDRCNGGGACAGTYITGCFM